MSKQHLYQPGMYEFSLDYKLPAPLPGTFQLNCPRIGEMDRVSVELAYKIELSASEVFDQDGSQVKDLTKSFAMNVQRPPTWRPRNVRDVLYPLVADQDHEDGSFEDSCVIEDCKLSATVDSVVHGPDDEVQVLCRVNCGRSEPRGLALQLCQNLTVSASSKKRASTSKVVRRHTAPLVATMGSDGVEQIVSLRLAPSSPTHQSLQPSLNSCFVTWEYRLLVVCETEAQEPAPCVAFPLAILA